MSSREYESWRAFDQVEPLGERRVLELLAALVSMLANMFRDSDKRPDAYTIDEVLGWRMFDWDEHWEHEPEEISDDDGTETWKEIFQKAAVIDAALGGRGITRGDPGDSAGKTSG